MAMRQPSKWPGHLTGFRQTPTLNGRGHGTCTRPAESTALRRRFGKSLTTVLQRDAQSTKRQGR